MLSWKSTVVAPGRTDKPEGESVGWLAQGLVSGCLHVAAKGEIAKPPGGAGAEIVTVQVTVCPVEIVTGQVTLVTVIAGGTGTWVIVVDFPPAVTVMTFCAQALKVKTTNSSSFIPALSV